MLIAGEVAQQRGGDLLVAEAAIVLEDGGKREGKLAPRLVGLGKQAGLLVSKFRSVRLPLWATIILPFVLKFAGRSLTVFSQPACRATSFQSMTVD